MNNVIVTTGYKLCQSIVSNGQVTGVQWQDPQNIFLSDGLFASSAPGNSAASDLIVGNFAFAIPSGAVVTGFNIKVIGKEGSQTVPPLTLTISAYDDTDGTPVFYPYTAPYTGLTPDNEEHILGGQNYLFGTTWTSDQANNLKLAFVANGDISLDSASVEAFYYVPNAPGPDPDPDASCFDCNSPIQVQKMTLKLPFKVTDTVFYLTAGSFAYANGTPVIPGDMGTCGGDIDWTFDQSLRRDGNSNFAENAVLPYDPNDVSTPTWTVLSDGTIKVDLKTLSNRGIPFHPPFTSDPNLISEHVAGSEVVISNNARFYSRFVRLCQAGIVFSKPIDGLDEGMTIVTALEKLNVVGDQVMLEQDGTDPKQANLIFVSNPTNTTPTPGSSSTGTTGAGTATSLTYSHTAISGENYLRVWVSTDDIAITSVFYGTDAMTLVGSKTNAPANEQVALYELVNPTVGAANIVVTMASAAHITSGGNGWNDVDIASPTDGVSAGNTGNGTAPTGTATTTTQNSVVQDVVGAKQNATTFAQTAPWSIIGQVSAAARPGATSYRRVLLSGPVTDTYSMSPTGDWTILTAGIRGSSLPTGGVQSVTGTYIDNTDPVNPVSVVPLNNTAGTDPTVNDAESFGYAVDSKWFNSSSGDFFTCTDATNGAAVWVLITGSAGTGITSINGDTTPAQTVVGTGAANVSTTGGVTTIDVPFGSGGSAGTKLAINTTPFSLSGTTAETDAYIVPVPGGNLGTNDALRISLVGGSILSSTVGQGTTARVKYGATTIGTMVMNPNSSSFNPVRPLTLFSIIVAKGNVALQVAQSVASVPSLAGSNQFPVNQMSNGSSSENSAILKNITITFENSDSSVTVAATGIIVEKISSSSPSGIARKGYEYKFAYQGSTPNYIPGAAFFGSFLIRDQQILTTDPNTNAIIDVTANYSVGWQQGWTISEDGLYLYTASAVPNGAFSNAACQVNQYDQTFTLIQTFTGTVTGPANNTVREVGVSGTQNFFRCATLVKGNRIVFLNLGLAANNTSANFFAVEFTLSGSSLTSAVATNLQNRAFIGSADQPHGFGGVSSAGTAYVQATNGLSVDSYSYASATFTFVATHTYPIGTASPLLGIGGFNVQSPTVIGTWRNTSVVSGSTNYLSAIYDEYTF